jgi:hypothetical protein
LLCTTFASSAVSLGEVQTSSRIGELLQVRIPLSAGPEDGVTSDCIRLEGPRTDIGDDLPWLRAGRLRLSTQANGQQMLFVTSLQAVQSPVIMLAVRVDCNATLRREYTLLLNPPAVNEAAPVLSLPATVPANVSDTAEKTSSIWRADKRESLRTIARSLFPADKALQSRYRSLLRQRNAVKLQGLSDSTPLPRGMEISVPDASELNEAAPPRVPTISSRDFSRAGAAKNVDEASHAARKVPGTQPQRRLVVGTGLAGRKELSEQEREKLRTELQLIASLDDKIATQLQLTEKLRQLEALQVRLQSDVQNLEARIRMQQATLANTLSGTGSAAGPAPLAANKASTSISLPGSPPSAWQGWLLAAGGILALFLLLVGWQRHRNSRYVETVGIAPPASEEQNQEQPVDDLFAPLSEEDIWPDAVTIKRPTGTNTGTDLPRLSDMGPSSILHITEDIEEHNSAVELAEIMMSFGRVQGAAQTLADFIRANPKQAVKPWVKLLEVYKTASMRPEFEALTSQLNKTFNVKPVSWDDFDVAMRAPESLEHIEHIAQKLSETWGKRECQSYLHTLLRDNRQGTRQGFPLAIIDEILLLLAILESQLGPYRHDIEPESPPVPQPTSPTMTAPVAPLTTPPIAPEVWTRLPVRKGESSSLDFDIGNSDFDLGLDTQDLTRTLHINLDDLPDETTQTNFGLDKEKGV